MAMRNLPEWPVSLFAVTAIGAIAAPLDGGGTGEERGHALDDAASIGAAVTRTA
jgi:acyl-CoA synthetase (AMP-forming)/AMP-acid ligase II